MTELKSTFDINIEKFLEQASKGYSVREGITEVTIVLTGDATEGAVHNELTVALKPQWLPSTTSSSTTVSLSDTLYRPDPYSRGEHMTGSMLTDDPLYSRIMSMVRYDLVGPSAMIVKVKYFIDSLGKLGENWDYSMDFGTSSRIAEIHRSRAAAGMSQWRKLVVHWDNVPEGKAWVVLYPCNSARPNAALCDDTPGSFVSALTDLFAELSAADIMSYESRDFYACVPKINTCIDKIAKYECGTQDEKPAGKLPGECAEGLGILDDSILDMLADGSLIAVCPPERTEFGAIGAMYDVSRTHSGWDFLRILSYETQGKIEWTMNGAGQDGADLSRDYAFDEKSSKKLYRMMSLLVEAQ